MGIVKNFSSLIKVQHTILAMPFAFVGYFVAIKLGGEFSWQTLSLVVVCMFFARSAAMAFNRYLDRGIDSQNPRTAVREIPAGVIQPKQALFFVIACCIGFITATAFINKVCLILSPFVLFIILFYSYTKRFTVLCHMVLGVGLAIAPTAAYLAVLPTQLSPTPFLFSLFVFLWISGFDIIYALQDADFDRENNLHSIPAKLGKGNALLVARLLHLGAIFILVWMGFQSIFNHLYIWGCLFFAIILIRQHILVTPHNLKHITLQYFTLNGIASIIFSLFVIASMFPF